MRKKTRREPQEREPIGMTKAQILLFLANNGKQTRSDISLHLGKQYNIVNKSNVKTHVQDLVKQNLMLEHDHGRGRDKSYYLSEQFEPFKKVYNFLKDNDQEAELVKSNYYQTLIENEDFQRKLFLNLFKDSTLKLYDNVQSDKFLKSFKTDNDRKEFKELLGSPADPDSGFYPLKVFLETVTVDEIDKIILEAYGKLKQALTTEKADIETVEFLLLIFSQNLYPQNEKEQIIHILKNSPTAIEFMINSEHANPLLTLRISLSHLIHESYKLKNKLKKKGSTTQKPNHIDIPITLILKPLYMYDLVNDKIINPDTDSDFLEKLITIMPQGVKE